MHQLIGAVEAGGTKMVCAVGTGPEHVHHEVTFPTGPPGECVVCLTIGTGVGAGIIDDFIVPPGLGDLASVAGCIALGQLALEAAS
ncbi:MAG: hypothetical protein WCF36_09315 [Candidatus Nanopelagicales bacterium]